MSLGQRIQLYYRLTKPGIIYGNILTATGGFLLASGTTVDIQLYLATVIGMSLIIASGCVVNNYIDRRIDQKMDRTKTRAIVLGLVSKRQAIGYAIVLCAIGFALLEVYVSTTVVALGIIALFDYLVLYGISKRRTMWGTVVGSVSGAMPVTAGYVAASGELDLGAFLLFLILVLWQMPHFYAIAMYRLKDYKAAGIPVLPAVLGMEITKLNILIYIVVFGAAISALAVTGYTGYTYLSVMAIMCLLWLYKGVKGFRAADDTAWARKMFGFSLLVLLAFSFMISVDVLLP